MTPEQRTKWAKAVNHVWTQLSDPTLDKGAIHRVFYHDKRILVSPPHKPVIGDIKLITVTPLEMCQGLSQANWNIVERKIAEIIETSTLELEI